MQEFHRLRFQKKFRGQSVRPVIVKLENFADKSTIFRNVYKLKGHNIFIREDLSRVTLKKQAELRPFLSEARKVDKKARLIHDCIMIKGTLYNKDKLDKLPLEVQRNTGCKKANGLTLFKGRNCPLSNLYDVQMTIDDVTYGSNEHYYQSQKCIEHNRPDIQVKVMKAPTGKKAMEEGKAVKATAEWTYTKGVSIMDKGASIKFQLDECRDFLLSTNGIIAEATTNGYWGIGIDIASSEALDIEKWSGSNLMGEILTNLRDSIIESLQSDGQMDTSGPG